MSEVVEILKTKAGYSDSEIAEKFHIEETDIEFVIKALGYLDGPTLHKLIDAFGRYQVDPKTKNAIFYLPKKQVDTTSKPEPVLEEGEYALSKSVKGKLGQLVPCLTDAENMVIDGFHRLKINPKAWTVKLDHVKTPVDRALARMTVNFCRRHYTSEEMKNDIGLLIGSGLSVEEIVSITGIGERTVRQYIPEHLKDRSKVEAGKKGAEIKEQLYERKPAELQQTVKTQETVKPAFTMESVQQLVASEVVDCEVCGTPMHRSKAKIVAGKLTCPKCLGIKPTSEPKLAPTPFKVKEKPEFRRAVMQPQKSKFELAVIQELQAEGLPLETDREFCVEKTVPDAVLKLKDRTVAIYVDNVATHKEGNERDKFLRSKLEKFYGFEICSVPYKNDSVEERQRAKETIREQLKW